MSLSAVVGMQAIKKIKKNQKGQHHIESEATFGVATTRV